ncbi:alpha/beta fold hydrolase [Ramlibacter algicola]|uniref:Alpha/beta hydrolase n=1 Tax=Ramlibacter algicola TaxID=2795217 RepID=A0A934UQJ8_9BURK|nr:alpha/beta hydrolase [Ramlibacter algicola]MBK0392200.1 alpha/beta hydrolase [Ramlibacter algicola]
MYQPVRPSRSEFVPIRRLRYHVRVWGEPGAGKVPLVLVHGWMDVAASWQFMVDAFSRDHYVIAPDWRGYGQTESPVADNYWFPDYLADLDFLLDHYAGDQPVDLVGHSMGGNVAMLYTGARPQRVRRLVNLEGFGMPATRPSQAPGRYGKWMDELKALYRHELDLKTYDDADGVARRLMKTNRRLSQDKADWLARSWARQADDGRWHILGDPAHKITNASLFRVDEVLELYRRIACPTLWVEASDDSLTQWWQGKFTLAEFHERLQAVPQLEKAQLPDSGHMLHHDQPQLLAELIERFIDR